MAAAWTGRPAPPMSCRHCGVFREYREFRNLVETAQNDCRIHVVDERLKINGHVELLEMIIDQKLENHAFE